MVKMSGHEGSPKPTIQRRVLVASVPKTRPSAAAARSPRVAGDVANAAEIAPERLCESSRRNRSHASEARLRSSERSWMECSFIATSAAADAIGTVSRTPLSTTAIVQFGGRFESPPVSQDEQP